MNNINEIFENILELLKSKSDIPYIEEFTVFIIVKTPSLKAFSKSIPDTVNKIEIANKDAINIKIVKKYLFVSVLFVFDERKETLFKYIWLGFVWESKLFSEYFIKVNIFTTLKPELVEKKEPPIITKIKNTNDKFSGTALKEIPKFDTLLEIDTNIFKKLLS